MSKFRLLDSLPNEFNTSYMRFLLNNRPEAFHRLRDGILGKGTLEEQLFCRAYCRIAPARFNRMTVNNVITA